MQGSHQERDGGTHADDPLDRLLDPDNDSVTLATLKRATEALGRKLKLDLA